MQWEEASRLRLLGYEFRLDFSMPRDQIAFLDRTGRYVGRITGIGPGSKS